MGVLMINSIAALTVSFIRRCMPSYAPVYRYARLLKKQQYNSIEENLRIQKDKLFKLLKHAYENSPYYHRIMKEKGVNPDQDRITEILTKLPILTKNIIRKEFDQLKAVNVDKKFKKNTSGGSTGEQAIFLQDWGYLEKSISAEMMFYEWAGLKEAQKLVKIWGAENEYLQNSKGIAGLKRKYFDNVHLLNSFMMSDENLTDYAAYINKIKPKVIEGYVQSIHEFAEYLDRKKIRIYSPKGIITSAGTLYPYMKEKVEKVFGCPIFNRYGSREVSGVAYSCNKTNHLHLNVFNQYIEILDDNLNPCHPGEPGEIYITNLNNYIMPLIRYKIGDVAVWSGEKTCACGRGLPLLERIVGRTGCMIRTEKGVIDSTALTTSFYYYESIKRYQFIQKTMKHFVIIIERAQKGKWDDDKMKLETKLKQLLGESINVEFDIVEKILPSKSGKYLYYINELDK
jgi:phenylacetate-CoA ligase